MKSFNKCIFLGRVGSEPIVDTFETHVKLSFILSIGYYSKKYEKMLNDFLPISFWRPKPNKRLASVKRGDLMMVDGRMISRSYDRDDKKYWVIEVLGHDFCKFDDPESEKSHEFKAVLAELEENKALIKRLKANTNELSKDVVMDITDKN